jgi:hypothetical protein
VISFKKIVKVADAICDCVPVVSTITNGLQLIYKTVRKVDGAANPHHAGRAEDIKIHVLSKTKISSYIGLLPVIGNVCRLLALLVNLPHGNLKKALMNDDSEIVDLCLARRPLSNCDMNKAVDKLRLAAYSSKPEILKRILGARKDWDVNACTQALRSCRTIHENGEENVLIIVEYYRNLKNTGVTEGLSLDESFDLLGGKRIKEMFIHFHEKPETANRILDLLPPCDFKHIQDILLKHAYRFHKNNAVLTEQQIQTIIDRCRSCTPEQLKEYFRSLQQKAAKFAKIAPTFVHSRLDAKQNIKDFYKVQSSIICRMVNKMEFKNEDQMISLMHESANLALDI